MLEDQFEHRQKKATERILQVNRVARGLTALVRQTNVLSLFIGQSNVETQQHSESINLLKKNKRNVSRLLMYY